MKHRLKRPQSAFSFVSRLL